MTALVRKLAVPESLAYAQAQARKDRKNAQSLFGFSVLSVVAAALVAVPSLEFALGLLVSGAGLALWGVWYRRRARSVESGDLPRELYLHAACLPHSMPERVRWRVSRALDARINLERFLVHVDEHGTQDWAISLRENATRCAARVLERSQVLLKLLEISAPSSDVKSSIDAVEAQLDRHLVELVDAMDAAATYIAAGTDSAARALSEHAERVRALGEGLQEAHSPRAWPEG